MDTPPADRKVMTVVSAVVAPDREPELIDGYREMTKASMPEGLMRSELLRGQQSTWRIETLWRDLSTLQALRASGVRPAALELFERVGAEHSHDFYFVEEDYALRAAAQQP